MKRMTSLVNFKINFLWFYEFRFSLVNLNDMLILQQTKRLYHCKLPPFIQTEWLLNIQIQNKMLKKRFFDLSFYISNKKIILNTGRIPMRHLVYRVQPLPQSMLPLVWDFGQLDNNVEKLYIIQMVQRCVCIIYIDN